MSKISDAELLQICEERATLRRLCDESEIALCHLGVSDDGQHEYSRLLAALRDALARITH